MDIGIIDEPKAVLRILLVLLKAKEPLEQKDVIKEARNRYSIGKTTTLTAIQVCEDNGLIKIIPEKRPRQARESLLHILTEKGKQMATIIEQIEKI